jgi:hypothetical protein
VTIVSQFIDVYIIIFWLSWSWDASSSLAISIFRLTKISSQLFYHQFCFILHGCTSGIVQLRDNWQAAPYIIHTMIFSIIHTMLFSNDNLNLWAHHLQDTTVFPVFGPSSLGHHSWIDVSTVVYNIHTGSIFVHPCFFYFPFCMVLVASLTVHALLNRGSTIGCSYCICTLWYYKVLVVVELVYY